MVGRASIGYLVGQHGHHSSIECREGHQSPRWRVSKYRQAGVAAGTSAALTVPDGLPSRSTRVSPSTKASRYMRRRQSGPRMQCASAEVVTMPVATKSKWMLHLSGRYGRYSSEV